MLAQIYIPIVCNADALLSLKREEIFCIRPRLEIAMQDDVDKDKTLRQVRSRFAMPAPPPRTVCLFLFPASRITCPIALALSAWMPCMIAPGQQLPGIGEVFPGWAGTTVLSVLPQHAPRHMPHCGQSSRRSILLRSEYECAVLRYAAPRPLWNR